MASVADATLPTSNAVGILNEMILQLNESIEKLLHDAKIESKSDASDDTWSDGAQQQKPLNSDKAPSDPDKNAHRTPKESDWHRKTKSMRQREFSTAREMEILRILHLSSQAVTLDDLMNRLIKVRLATDRNRGTIVTQLARMRADKGLIDRPYEGVYAITQGGSEHFLKFKVPYADLLVPDNLR